MDIGLEIGHKRRCSGTRVDEALPSLLGGLGSPLMLRAAEDKPSVEIGFGTVVGEIGWLVFPPIKNLVSPA